MAIDQYGQIIRRTPRPIPIRSNPNINYEPLFSHDFTRRRSLWERFDNFIGNIGNWFADNSDTITSVLAILLLICMAIPFIGWLISLGWLWGIVAGIFLGGIAYYAAMIVVGIFMWIGNIGMAVIRYIFYSGASFLITLAVAGVLLGIGVISSSNSHTTNSTKNEYVIPQTTKYYCTAGTFLNVRSAPYRNARVIGTLKPNQIVDVYETTNGFAKIKYNGSVGYASIKYLNKR